MSSLIASGSLSSVTTLSTRNLIDQLLLTCEPLGWMRGDCVFLILLGTRSTGHGTQWYSANVSLACPPTHVLTLLPGSFIFFLFFVFYSGKATVRTMIVFYRGLENSTINE